MVSGQSVDSSKKSFILRVDRGEANAFRQSFGLISRTVSRKSFDFISELYSSGFLSQLQFEDYLKKHERLRHEGKEWTEQNCEILLQVTNVISEKPEMFYKFCTVLEKLHYGECSKEMKGAE